MSYRVRCLYDVHGWAYHSRCIALREYAPDDFEVEVVQATQAEDRASLRKPVDLILQLCYSHTKDLRGTYDDWNRCPVCSRRFGPTPLIVAGLNIGASTEQRSWLESCRREADATIINSRQAWQESGKLPDTHWISNGVDQQVYYINERTSPIEDRAIKVLWTGSYFHRVKGTKRYDEIMLPLSERLDAMGIPHEFRVVNSHGGKTRWSASRMNRWYNSGTIYVCASRTEGTPNPALEAASAGCVLVSTAVGNMPELIRDGVNGYLVEPDVDAFVEAIQKVRGNYLAMARAMQEDIEAWHWQHRAGQYFDLFRELIDKRRASAAVECVGTLAD